MNFNKRLRAGALVALGLVVAVLAVGLNLRSSVGPTAAPSATPTPAVPASAPASPSGSFSLSAPPVVALKHFDRNGLAFDYPADWTATVSGLNEHYITILDFLGTGTGMASCHPMTPGPSDQFISGTTCSTDISVGPGQVVVELDRSDGPPRPSPIDPSDVAGLQAGQTYVTVGGLPAIFYEQAGTGDSGDTLVWTLSVPGQLISRYILTAQIKGPGVAQMHAQVDALVASIEYDPPIAVLVPADGPRIAAIGLAESRADDTSYACFPTVPGATATATVTQLQGYSPLRKPLPVTCTMSIEPRSIGLWMMTLTESWTAASDRTAGSYTTILWLEPDGTRGTSISGPPSEIPYWP